MILVYSAKNKEKLLASVNGVKLRVRVSIYNMRLQRDSLAVSSSSTDWGIVFWRFDGRGCRNL